MYFLFRYIEKFYKDYKEMKSSCTFYILILPKSFKFIAKFLARNSFDVGRNKGNEEIDKPKRSEFPNFAHKFGVLWLDLKQVLIGAYLKRQVHKMWLKTSRS